MPDIQVKSYFVRKLLSGHRDKQTHDRPFAVRGHYKVVGNNKSLE